MNEKRISTLDRRLHARRGLWREAVFEREWLRKENTRLREALEFYTNPWWRDNDHQNTRIMEDGGRIARAALEVTK